MPCSPGQYSHIYLSVPYYWYWLSIWVCIFLLYTFIFLFRIMLVFGGSHSFAITCVLVMLLVCCITICVCIVVTSICPVISLFSILSCTLPDSSPRTSPYPVLSFRWGDVLLPRNRPVVADVNSPWSHMPYWSSRSHPRTS